MVIGMGSNEVCTQRSHFFSQSSNSVVSSAPKDVTI